MSRKILSFELDLDFILIALTSPLRDYRLCYHINKELHADFRKTADYCLPLVGGAEPLRFSQYVHNVEAFETEFYIIANQGAAGCLIPELSNINYFLLIKNHFDEEDLADVLFRLKKIVFIESVKQIDPKAIQSHENLLF